MFCQKCGSKSIEGASFCQKCGFRLLVDEAEQQPEASTIDGEETAGQLDVTLTYAGTDKVKVIKKVRELTGLGVKEARKLVENPPSFLKKGVTQAEAKSIKEEFLQTGATAIFTNQEGTCVNIIAHCKACGAALEDGSDTCKFCGHIVTAQPNRDTTTAGVNTTDSVSFNVWAELFQEFKKMPVIRKVIPCWVLCLLLALLFWFCA